ncbi:hypothetical protein [Natronomonas gomsonensis]|uniref:hypothetical protein n=1 Tax=Natronomonas gomsonensis TaxID=1046043 RepID=UPI0015C1776A|nr:hypothetical protein [Natronomonas gomsonensis]
MALLDSLPFDSPLPSPTVTLAVSVALFGLQMVAIGTLPSRPAVAVAVGTALLGGAALFVALRLYAPVLSAVLAVPLVTIELSLLGTVVLPGVLVAGGVEYGCRRLLGRNEVRLSAATEASLAAGIVVGALWTGMVHVLSPGGDDFSVVARSIGVDGYVAPLAELAFVAFGPLLVVGLPVALVARFGLLSPLLFAAVEVGSFLSEPSGGDTVGSAASLLWPAAVPLLLGTAAIELWVRREAVPALDARLAGG